MKVFIYDNKEKDCCGQYLKELIDLLIESKIEYKQLFDADLYGEDNADAIFTLGGDGTILWVTEFANRNNIPIIGINAGKVGFLTEFDRLEMAEAVNLLKENKLEKDCRFSLEVSVNEKKSYCLNDVFVQRLYSEDVGCMTIDVSVAIDNKAVEKFKGDGVIVSSSTGSTAYSLAAGGAILAPDVQAMCVTPIAAHALGLRSLVFSAESVCELKIIGKTHGTLFVDGRLVAEIGNNDVVVVKKSKYVTTFLRKSGFNFYKILSQKIKDGFQG